MHKTACWTIPDILGLHLLGSWLSSTPQDIKGNKRLLHFLFQQEKQNSKVSYFGKEGFFWIPIHLSLLCMEISIQIVGGQKIWHTPGHYLDKVLEHGWSPADFFTKAENYMSRIPNQFGFSLKQEAAYEYGNHCPASFAAVKPDLKSIES